MTPERLAELRAKINCPDYMDKAIDGVAEELLHGSRKLEPVRQKQVRTVESYERVKERARARYLEIKADPEKYRAHLARNNRNRRHASGVGPVKGLTE